MLPIQHAARALGVPDDQLRRLAKQGTVPGAVDRGGEWLIPTMSLVAIAKQQGWTLDLAALQQQLDEQSLSRYSGDALAAQAAVLLAKTQATAARVESRDLLRRLREATTTAAADRAARVEATRTAAKLERELEEARRSHAVAEAKLTELRTRLSSDDQQFQFMVDRIKSLEQERHRLTRSLGWFGRLRYRRLVEQDLARPPDSAAPPPDPQDAGSAEEQRAAPVNSAHGAVSSDGKAPTLEPLHADVPVRGRATEADTPEPVNGERLAPAAAGGPSPVSVSLPAVPIAGAATVTEAPAIHGPPRDQVRDNDRDMPATGGRRPRRSDLITRTADGRFEGSALAISRSSSSLPAR